MNIVIIRTTNSSVRSITWEVGSGSATQEIIHLYKARIWIIYTSYTFDTLFFWDSFYYYSVIYA
jgi:hypothetical protein